MAIKALNKMRHNKEGGFNRNPFECKCYGWATSWRLGDIKSLYTHHEKCIYHKKDK